MFKVNEQQTGIFYLIKPSTGLPVTGATVTCKLFDENFNEVTPAPTVTEIGDGLYRASFTPDAAGVWTLVFICSDERQYGVIGFPVGMGLEADIDTNVDTLLTRVAGSVALESSLSTHDSDIKSRLDHATYGLSALKTEIDANETKIDAAQSDITAIKAKTDNLPTDPADQSAVEAAITSAHTTTNGKVDNVQTDVSSIKATVDTNLDATVSSRQASWGADASTKTNIDTTASRVDQALSTMESNIRGADSDTLKTLSDQLDAVQADLDNPDQYKADVSSLALESSLSTHDSDIKSRLDNATYGLSALKTLIDTVQADLDSPDQYKADVSNLDVAVSTRAPANEYDTQLDATISSRQADWGAVPQTKTNIDTVALRVDQSLSTTESNIRGADNDTLKTISDQLDAVQSDLDNPDQYKADVSALALEATLSSHDSDIKGRLDNATYGLSALNTDLDTTLTRIGDPSGDSLTSLTAKLGDPKGALGSLIQAASTTTGTPTVNFFDTNLTEATDDHYVGNVILFTSGDLAGQSSIIVDYDGTTKEITVDPAFIEAPASGDSFVILSVPLGALRTGSKGLEQIYDLIDQMLKLGRIGDTVTTDGTEQTIFIVDNPDFPFEPTKLLIDFTNNTASETVDVNVYYRIKEGGSYVLHSTLSYSGVQSPPLKDIDLLPNTFGVKVTVQKTAGSNLSYDYEVYLREK